jgi:hypothetical protein
VDKITQYGAELAMLLRREEAHRSGTIARIVECPDARFRPRASSEDSFR